MTEAIRMSAICMFSTAVGPGIVFATRSQSGVPQSKPVVLNVPIETVIPPSRFPGILPLKSPILVEFSDYQCPPCRSLEDSLSKESLGLKRVIRHLPLKMHRWAYDSAVIAEKARFAGNFDSVSRELFSVALDKKTLDKISVKYSITSKMTEQAEKVVNEDKRTADELKLRGTPSMILCLPDGKIMQIQSISQLKGLLE